MKVKKDKMRMRKEVMMKVMNAGQRNVDIVMRMTRTVTEQANVVTATSKTPTMQTVDILSVTMKYLAAMKISFCLLTEI